MLHYSTNISKISFHRHDLPFEVYIGGGLPFLTIVTPSSSMSEMLIAFHIHVGVPVVVAPIMYYTGAALPINSNAFIRCSFLKHTMWSILPYTYHSFIRNTWYNHTCASLPSPGKFDSSVVTVLVCSKGKGFLQWYLRFWIFPILQWNRSHWNCPLNFKVNSFCISKCSRWRYRGTGREAR